MFKKGIIVVAVIAALFSGAYVVQNNAYDAPPIPYTQEPIGYDAPPIPYKVLV